MIMNDYGCFKCSKQCFAHVTKEVGSGSPKSCIFWTFEGTSPLWPAWGASIGFWLQNPFSFVIWYFDVPSFLSLFSSLLSFSFHHSSSSVLRPPFVTSRTASSFKFEIEESAVVSQLNHLPVENSLENFCMPPSANMEPWDVPSLAACWLIMAANILTLYQYH